tara:strand:+ start:1629 stop:1862 length:234 start_codon:yes stop_codon:yes gene_type:complete
MSVEQLVNLNKLIVHEIKHRRKGESLTRKASLSVGQTVSWDGRRGRATGTITAIKRTKVLVDTPNGIWNVPISMLEA